MGRFQIFLLFCSLLTPSLFGCTSSNSTPDAGGPPDGWVRFSSALAGFSARYPAPPSETVEENEHAFRLTFAGGERVVSVRYMANADTSVPIGDRLAAGNKANNATDVVVRDIDVDGQRGLEAIYQGNVQGERIVVRHAIFYRGGAMFQVIGVRGPAGGESDIDRFFAEFHFLTKGRR